MKVVEFLDSHLQIFAQIFLVFFFIYINSDRKIHDESQILRNDNSEYWPMHSSDLLGEL